MSFLNSTATVLHASPLPDGATQKQAIAMLQDYEFFLHCDPHMAKFEKLSSGSGTGGPTQPAQQLPDRVKGRVKATSGMVPYSVTDVVHTLPAGLWDSNVVSTYEFTSIELGVFVRIRSPLNVVMDTIWEIREGEGEGGRLELVEDVWMGCSRLLIGVVKAQCEGGWAQIHAKMMERLKRELEGASAEASGPSAANGSAA